MMIKIRVWLGLGVKNRRLEFRDSELGIGIRDWGFKLGICIGIATWIRSGDWEMRIWDRYLGIQMSVMEYIFDWYLWLWMGYRDWGLGIRDRWLMIGIGDWNFILNWNWRSGIEIGDWGGDWELGLKMRFGIGNWDWGLGFGIRILIWIRDWVLLTRILNEGKGFDIMVIRINSWDWGLG